MPIANPKISIAPMMGYTDRHFCYFMRLLTKQTVLYTEMLTAASLVYGKMPDRNLDYSSVAQPLTLQLGGANPKLLGQAAKSAASYRYTELNLNVGCPSPRVGAGQFGASLFLDPERVANCLSAMQEASTLKVSVKTRTGVDEHDHYDDLASFVNKVSSLSDCQVFIIHARKAWLSGLNPKQNRTLPPLQYERVYQLKRDFPHLTIVLNGGVTTWSAVKQHLQQVDGVMIGRMAVNNPYPFVQVDNDFFEEYSNYNDSLGKTRQAIVHDYLLYLSHLYPKPRQLTVLLKPLQALCKGLAGTREWRNLLGQLVRQVSELTWATLENKLITLLREKNLC